MALRKDGATIKQIIQRTGHSRNSVRHILRTGRADVFRTRTSSIEAWLPRLDAEWAAGCRNGAELWRRLRSVGFNGSLRVVTEWTTRRRRSELVLDGRPRNVPSARSIARLMTLARHHLTKADAVLLASIEAAVPALVTARDLAEQFQAMIRRKAAPELDAWVVTAGESLIASFAVGIAKDRTAVASAISEPWSNGQTEGQITKLKLVRRQMYGRGNLDLLLARLTDPT